MRIALTLLSGIGYGGMTYFRHVLPALAAIDARNEYHCFVPEQHPLIASLHAPNITFHEVVNERTTASERFQFEQLVLPRALRRHRIDLLYTAKNIAVFHASCPQVIAIRNMEPLRYREFHNAWTLDVWSRMRWELTKRSLARADVIIAVSHAVRDAVIARFPAAAQKISVVYNGNPVTPTVSSDGIRHRGTASLRTTTPYDDTGSDTVQRSTTPFLLTASKFVAYANQLALIEAYALLCRERPDTPELHFAGGVHDRTYFTAVQRRIAALEIGPRIRLLGFLPQGELHTRMRAATAFVFPSLLEACPHTLLEAMACGVPIATSNVPPMPELCGDAAAYFAPRDPENIARAIAKLLDDATFRAQLVPVGHARVAEFTWERTARGLLAAFQRALMCNHGYADSSRIYGYADDADTDRFDPRICNPRGIRESV